MSDRSGRGSIAGFRLTDRARVSDLGTWIDAVAPGGGRAGVLRFDPRVIAQPGARDRLVAAVLADRRLTQGGVSGLVPVADVVSADEEVWLLAGHAVSPALTELISSPVMDSASAAAVLVETAQTLLAVHAAGLAHGAVHPGTVVISDDGATLLAERGLADAARGQAPAPERDVAAWAALARGLAASWASGRPRAAELLERAATTATTRGLTAARDVILTGREALPGGLISRDLLSEMARRWSALDVATQSLARQDEGDIVTLLRVPTEGPGAPRLHFGTGIPTEASHKESTAEQIWRQGREKAAPASQSRSRAARARRRRTILSATVFALVMAGAVLAWFTLGSAPDLVVESASVSAPKKAQKCGKPATITGTIATNGAAGKIDYEWKQSDKKEPIKGTDTVRSGETSHEVTLRWSVSGEGSFKGVATLRVLSPVAAGKKIEDKASITFTC